MTKKNDDKLKKAITKFIRDHGMCKYETKESKKGLVAICKKCNVVLTIKYDENKGTDKK